MKPVDRVRGHHTWCRYCKGRYVGFVVPFESVDSPVIYHCAKNEAIKGDEPCLKDDYGHCPFWRD